MPSLKLDGHFCFPLLVNIFIRVIGKRLKLGLINSCFSDEAPINKTLFNEAGGKAINHKYLLHPQLGPRYFKNIRKNLANIQSNIFSDKFGF